MRKVTTYNLVYNAAILVEEGIGYSRKTASLFPFRLYLFNTGRDQFDLNQLRLSVNASRF